MSVVRFAKVDTGSLSYIKNLSSLSFHVNQRPLGEFLGGKCLNEFDLVFVSNLSIRDQRL